MSSLSLLEMLQGWSPFDISCDAPRVISHLVPVGLMGWRPADLDAARPRASIGRVSLTDERG